MQIRQPKRLQRSPVARFRIDLEYDGSLFYGWQRQVGQVSVQEVVEQALTRLCGHPVTLFAAGRTDTGVHALGQVAHFDTGRVRPPSVLHRALNAITPPSVSITAVTPVADDFHARFSARGRSYLYRINDRRRDDQPVPLVFGRQERLYHERGRLDTDAMDVAARMLVGEHDCSAFRAASCTASTPVRRIYHSSVSRDQDDIAYTVIASGFLHHMVRNIVGSLLLVGQQLWTPDDFLRILRGRDRTLAGPTAPPHGLYLARVFYGEEEAWAG